jgi:hypothetical protein
MNAEQALDEMGLAAYLLAEAERNERAAKRLRMEAGQKMAAVHAYFRAGVERAKIKKEHK